MDDPATAPFCFAHLRPNDHDIGNAEQSRDDRQATRLRTTEQEARPEVNFGAVGVRSWPKRYCGRLYTVTFRFCPAECQHFGRTASAPKSFRSNTGSGCRHFEGHSVSTAATGRCFEGHSVSTAKARRRLEGHSVSTATARRRLEGHSVSTAAARRRATGEWILVATKHNSASAGFNYV